MQVGASFSRGHSAYFHDVRQGKLPPNVNPALSSRNVVLVDNLQGRTIEEYTNERMQPYIDEYNAKQKRKDRKINETYCEKRLKDSNLNKTPLVEEYVLQYGEHKDLGGEFYDLKTSPERRQELYEEYQSVYRHWLSDFQARFPHVEVVWATIHFDEPGGTPHLHMAVQGIGDDYKQGLSHQVSMCNALKCDGVERVLNRKEAEELGGYQKARMYKIFREEYQQPLLKSMGYDIKPSEKGQEHLSPRAYREVMSEAEGLLIANQLKKIKIDEKEQLVHEDKILNALTELRHKSKEAELIEQGEKNALVLQEAQNTLQIAQEKENTYQHTYQPIIDEFGTPEELRNALIDMTDRYNEQVAQNSDLKAQNSNVTEELINTQNKLINTKESLQKANKYIKEARPFYRWVKENILPIIAQWDKVLQFLGIKSPKAEEIVQTANEFEALESSYQEIQEVMDEIDL